MTDATQTDQDRAIDVAAALQAALGDRLRAVVLYGSRARGDHRPDSDWDIFVIADRLPDHPVDRSWEFYRMLPEELRGSVGILARTPEEFEARLAELYLEIALDARILYDRDGYVADRLAEIRRLLDQAGLYRERTPIGYVWKWRTPPMGIWSIEWEH